MANLLIPRREIWTQQPQGSIDIDWGNPITRSLKFAFLGGEYVESVSKKQATVTSFTKKPTGAGMGYVQTGTGSVAYAISPLTGGACTIVSKFYFKPSASLYTECVAQILPTGDTSRVGLYANLDQSANITSGSIALLVRINSPNTVRAAISGVSEGWHTVVAVWGGGSTISMWLDAKPATVTHNNLGTLSSFFAAGQVVRTFGNGAPDNPVVFGAGINRAVSEAEARSLSDNPYQIFEPKVRQLFVPVSAGGTTSVSSDSTSSYNLLGSVQSSVSASYGVIGAVQSDASASYSVRGAITKDASAAYNILSATSVTSSTTVGYNIIGSLTKDAASSYNVLGSVLKDSAATYSIRNTVTQDASASYSILSSGAVTSSITAGYAIKGTLQSDIVVGYSIAAAVQAEISASYFIHQAVEKDAPATYFIRGSVSKAISAAYAVDGSTAIIYARAPTGAGPLVIKPSGNRPPQTATTRPSNTGGRRL